MNTQYNTQEKPTLVNVIAWMTLASGVTNLIWGVAASGTALATVVGIICIPFTILPTILGVFELVYAAKLFSNPAQPVQPSTNIAVFEIASVLTGNVFSMVVGILALVFYNDTIVKDYFARLNGIFAPATSIVPVAPIVSETPVTPSTPPIDAAAPVMPEPPQPPEPPAEEFPYSPSDKTP
ncbi:MAG TPA: hypothetical protein VNA23_01520 [Anaerolineales bacterium]|nr:hypothetical protein [Anaerolineales bacterium]